MAFLATQFYSERTESSVFIAQPVQSGNSIFVTCTSLRLTALPRDRTLQLLIHGAKLRPDLLRLQKSTFSASE